MKPEEIKFDYISDRGTCFFRFVNPFLWGVHLITGFFQGNGGIGWLSGSLMLNQRGNYPVSEEQGKVFKRVAETSKTMFWKLKYLSCSRWCEKFLYGNSETVQKYIARYMKGKNVKCYNLTRKEVEPFIEGYPYTSESGLQILK